MVCSVEEKKVEQLGKEKIKARKVLCLHGGGGKAIMDELFWAKTLLRGKNRTR